MAIPDRTAKFKSTNTLAIAILGSTAKFNSHHYFWLCSILFINHTTLTHSLTHSHTHSLTHSG